MSEKDLNRKIIQNLSIVSHEIQTPVNLIAMTATILNKKAEKNCTNNSQIKDYMDNIVMNCNKIELLVNNILGINMVSISKKEYVNSRQLFDTFCETIEPYCNYSDVNFNGKFNVRKEFIHIPVITTERILLNLITNAVKYNDKKKKNIEFKMYNEGDNIFFSVKDNGIGISEENIEKVTEEFFRVNNETSNGFGIGLALVKEYISMMNGSLNIKSQLKKGTEITVSIPSTPDDMIFTSNEKDYIYIPEKSVFEIEFSQFKKPKGL